MTKSNENSQRDSLKIVIVGHVDHGKSTVVGRLFHDTGSLPEGKYEAIKAMCDQRGMVFEYAFLMDAMQAERDQGITIDTSQIWFKTDKRDYVIIDAPGHTEFLKNMITGAASSEAAVLVIDANEGVQEQSRKHGYLLHLLGVRQIAVAVNKMDMIAYDQEKFDAIEQEYRDYLTSIGVEPTYLIPISAREGDNIAHRSDNMAWYKGPTLVEALDSFKDTSLPVDAPLRFPIQDVYKFDERRILAGRIESGTLNVGDNLIFSPSNKKARVKSIEAWSVPDVPETATAGQSIGVTLDTQLFIERGELASHIEHAPLETDIFTARLFWLSHQPLTVGHRYSMKLHTGETQVEVEEIRKVINTDTLSEGVSDKLERNSIGEVVLRAKRMLALDSYDHIAASGRFVLIDNYNIAGGGIINTEGYADQRDLITRKSENITRVSHDVTEEARAARNGHVGGTLWFTGLSGSGKSTLSVLVEKRLFQKGYQSYVLDGDNVRHGLNINLGFSPEDRAENIRRIGEVAALFSRAGMVAITSFISPYRSDRNKAREAVGPNFHEIYIRADVEDCEKRDPKGLYKKARSGEIAEFTGISAPYEPPLNPELVVDTVNNDIESCVDQIVDYIEEHLSVSRVKGLDYSI